MSSSRHSRPSCATVLERPSPDRFAFQAFELSSWWRGFRITSDSNLDRIRRRLEPCTTLLSRQKFLYITQVPVRSLKLFARDFCAYAEWVRRTISPVFWARIVVSLNSIWVGPEPPAPTAPGQEDQRGSLERFLCKVEEKMRDGTWNEVAEGIKYIEIVECSNLENLRVGDGHFQEQMLRLSRALDGLRGLRVFKSVGLGHCLKEHC